MLMVHSSAGQEVGATSKAAPYCSVGNLWAEGTINPPLAKSSPASKNVRVMQEKWEGIFHSGTAVNHRRLGDTPQQFGKLVLGLERKKKVERPS
jgi:hypothetical protein